MEDSSNVISNFLDTPGNAYYAVFDGHGGGFASKWCASNMYKVLAKNLTLFSSHWSVPAILASTFDQVDRRFPCLANYDQSGCTAAIAYIKTDASINVPTVRRRYSFSPAPCLLYPSAQTSKRTLYTANVGDSRLVLCTRGVARRLAHDHRALDPSEMHRIESLGGQISRGRVNGSLAVSRALGDPTFKPFVTSRPYTTELILDDQDEFLIIACDGVWDMCSDQDAVDLVRHIEDPTKASQELVRHALFNGSMDNITCVVVRFKAVAECSQDNSETRKVINVMDTAILADNEIPSKKGRDYLMSTTPQSQRFNNPPRPSAGPSWESSRNTNDSEGHAINHPGSQAFDRKSIQASIRNTHLAHTTSNSTNTTTRPNSRANTTSPAVMTTPTSTNSGALNGPPSREFHHMRSASFSPSVLSRRKGTEHQEIAADSSLDRYGRFKRTVHLEYDYEQGDDCAIADSDSE